MKLIFGGSFILAIIFGLLKSYFSNGITITQNNIQIIRKSLTGQSLAEKVEFNEIQNLKWNHGGYRQDRAIYLKTKDGRKFKICIPEDQFKFGHTLKFIKNKGVEIKLVHSDHELQLFLDGKISQFPMENEPTA